MKEMNSLENQLRSWAPRGPSATLKRRIFGPATDTLELVRAVRWLAPAAVCALFVFAGFNRDDETSAAQREPMFAMIQSNQTLVTYRADSPAPRRNTLPQVTLEWTKSNGTPSSITSFWPGKAD